MLIDVINENITCPAVGYQPATICVPVTVEPFAKAGITRTKCCGDALVIPGRQGCTGIKNGVCTFTVSQNICVAVPVEFGVCVSGEQTQVHCSDCR